MTYLICILLSIPLSLPVLWLLYLAVMNLKRSKEAGTLSTWAAIFGYPWVWVAYLVDFYCNTLLFSILLWEWPQWQNGELLVTDRLKRTRRTGSGRRLALANWFVPLLNPFDPSGDHI